MPELYRRLPDQLFEISDTDREAEAQLSSGRIPERWMKIEALEVERMTQELAEVLQERAEKMSQEELQVRLNTLQRHWDELMLSPSFPGGPYALRQHLNFYELLPRVIDIKADEALVPDKDERISFSSLAFDKGMIILSWLRERVQNALAEDDRLREAQLKKFFNNVSQRQLNQLTQEIAQSGLTLLPEPFMTEV